MIRQHIFLLNILFYNYKRFTHAFVYLSFSLAGVEYSGIYWETVFLVRPF